MPQHPIIVPTVLLLAASLWKRNRWLVRWNFLVLCAGLFSFGGFQIPWPFWKSSRPTIRVMTWNVRGWELGPQTAPEFLRKLSPDIACIEEPSIPYAPNSTASSPREDANWYRQFPGYHVVKGSGVVLLSRYPVIDWHTQEVTGGFGRQLLVARWQTPQGLLTTVGVHVSTALAPGVVEHNEYNEPHRWKTIIRHAKDTALARETQWPDIENSVAGVSGPFVVMGDFNNPPRGLLYHRLSARWKDAFAQAGLGTGFTFPAHYPLIRIDYIWLSPSIRVNRCFETATRASDHRPLIADISL